MKVAFNFFSNIIIVIILVHWTECREVKTVTSLLSEDKFKKIQLECQLETQADPDLILKLKTGNWKLTTPLHGAYTVTTKYSTKPPVELQKWTLCLLVKAGLMSKQGIFKLDAPLLANSTTEIVHKIDLCLPKQHFLPHQIAWLFLKCYNRENPKKLILI